METKYIFHVLQQFFALGLKLNPSQVERHFRDQKIDTGGVHGACTDYHGPWGIYKGIHFSAYEMPPIIKENPAMTPKKVAKSIKHPYDFWLSGLVSDVCSVPRRFWGIFTKASFARNPRKTINRPFEDSLKTQRSPRKAGSFFHLPGSGK